MTGEEECCNISESEVDSTPLESCQLKNWKIAPELQQRAYCPLNWPMTYGTPNPIMSIRYGTLLAYFPLVIIHTTLKSFILLEQTFVDSIN